MGSHLTDTTIIIIIIHDDTKIHPHLTKSPRSASNYCLGEHGISCAACAANMASCHFLLHHKRNGTVGIRNQFAGLIV